MSKSIGKHNEPENGSIIANDYPAVEIPNLMVYENSAAFSLSDDNSVLSLIKTIRKGIKYLNFNNIVNNSPFSLQDWSQFLHLSDRTMQRYKKEKKSFDALHSEKILEIVMLYNKGIVVFGYKEKFNTWLETSNVALGGSTPKSFLDSSMGIQLVKDELVRIEHGVLA